MKKLTIIAIIIALLLICGMVHHNTSNKAEWENTRCIKTITVCRGDTLDGIGYEYKPSWMDVREYTYYIKELNNMDNANLYAGQSLDVYVEAHQYTLDGLVLDNGNIITANGHEWSYDTDILGCVRVTFNDYGTTDNVEDDIIVSIK